MAMPIAVPTMPDSASGVSITRASPKSFCRPSVMRKTPPSLPMSSPISTTLGSSSMALRRPAFSALAMLIVVIPPARRVIGRGVRAHAVGVGLDEERALPRAGVVQRTSRDGQAGEHVVAVDAQAGKAEPAGPLKERHPRLAFDRLRDRPLVVLAE